jgi:hypothetical protein
MLLKNYFVYEVKIPKYIKLFKKLPSSSYESTAPSESIQLEHVTVKNVFRAMPLLRSTTQLPPFGGLFI